MKGPKELKRYYQVCKEHLKAINYDSLLWFKLERCKKYRKTGRRPRDGYIHNDKFEDLNWETKTN